MAKESAGLLVYRRRASGLEVFLVHPGGPFWRNKDDGAWSIPKGELTAGEEPLAAAQREFQEETGFPIARPFTPLHSIKQRGGKIVHAWLVEADFDASQVKSNTFIIEWPPRSGKQQEFPEVDRAEWFDLETATRKINEGQRGLLQQIAAIIPPAPD
jgi:predicted NUDIX family NTP pyrophosphohydrolase